MPVELLMNSKYHRGNHGRKLPRISVGKGLILFAACQQLASAVEGNYCLFTHSNYSYNFDLQLGFKVTDSAAKKLNLLLDWSKPYMSRSDGDPKHFDVFSYITE